jgi:hypothetical protein
VSSVSTLSLSVFWTCLRHEINSVNLSAFFINYVLLLITQLYTVNNSFPILFFRIAFANLFSLEFFFLYLHSASFAHICVVFLRNNGNSPPDC